jgi:hypothetical protein
MYLAVHVSQQVAACVFCCVCAGDRDPGINKLLVGAMSWMMAAEGYKSDGYTM